MTFLSSTRDGYGNLVNEYRIRITEDLLGTGSAETIIRTTFGDRGWSAVEQNYDGPEDHYRIAWHETSEIEAMNQLVEKLEDNYSKLF